ncbi:MAG: tRNA (adenosine(37)-N6)-threonylcarbamoyltransferase complex ATPase subunit type 1 TsaE [Pseudomonadota bacterium]
MHTQTRAFRIASEEEMEDFGATLSTTVIARDVIGLIGPLGVGKSVFARSLIRALVGRPVSTQSSKAAATLSVPSPTFTLLETYDTTLGQLSHLDLYRLPTTDGQIKPADAHQLGLEDAMTRGPVLIEWADRALDLLPAETILIAIAPDSHDAPADATERQITIAAPSGWFDRPQTATLLPYEAP